MLGDTGDWVMLEIPRTKFENKLLDFSRKMTQKRNMQIGDNVVPSKRDERIYVRWHWGLSDAGDPGTKFESNFVDSSMKIAQKRILKIGDSCVFCTGYGKIYVRWHWGLSDAGGQKGGKIRKQFGRLHNENEIKRNLKIGDSCVLSNGYEKDIC